MGMVGRFNTLTYSSFMAAFLLSAVFLASGFLTFGGASQGAPLPVFLTFGV